MRYMGKCAVGILTVALTACGGGGGGGGNNNNSGGGNNNNGGTPGSTAQPPAATPSFMFFVGSVTAVDPRTGSETVLATGPIPAWAGALPAGTYDPATRTMSDLHTQWVVYASGGNLWKVSADINGVPTPLRVSSETQATSVCQAHGGPDLANPANARIAYALPGADGNCQASADNVWRAVSVGMDDADAPIDAKPVLTSFPDTANGSLGGWLVREGNDLKVYDADFTTGTTLITATRLEYLPGGSSDKLLIRADNGIHVFDASTRTLSPARRTLANVVYSYARDQSNVWILDGDEFYRFSLNNSDTAVKVAEDQTDVRNSNIAIADDRIVYILARPGATPSERISAIKSMPKTGGAPTVLADNLSAVGGFAVAGSRVYFNTVQNNVPTAWSMLVDGTQPAAIPNAAWTDSVARAEVSSQRGREIHTIMLSEGFVNLATQFGGGTLSSYDAETFTRIATLGQIPADVELIRLGTGAGRYFLGIGYGDPATAGSPPNQDIFFIDTFTNSSLRRITTTPLIESAIQ